MELHAIRELAVTPAGVARATRQEEEPDTVAAMRRLAIVCLLLVASCKKEEKEGSPAPAPAPKETEKAKPEPKPEAKPAPAPEDDGCAVKVAVTKDKITWDGGGITGEAPRATADLSALAPLAGTCSVDMTAADDLTYQQVIDVMDQLVKHGLKDIGLGTADDSADSKATAPRPDGIPPDVAKAPIIVITTKEVTVNGKVVAELADGDFSALLAAALPPNPTDPTIVLQCDKALDYGAVRIALETADKAGYTNVLFAVKTK
jgi:biopolymer transport protein ExbD